MLKYTDVTDDIEGDSRINQANRLTGGLRAHLLSNVTLLRRNVRSVDESNGLGTDTKNKTKNPKK